MGRNLGLDDVVDHSPASATSWPCCATSPARRGWDSLSCWSWVAG